MRRATSFVFLLGLLAAAPSFAEVAIEPPPPQPPRVRALPPAPVPKNLNAILTAPLPSLPPGPRRVVGRVLGPKGPVASATVTACEIRDPVFGLLRGSCIADSSPNLRRCGCGSRSRELVAILDERRGEDRPLARATTSPDGSFEFPALPKEASRFWVDAPGLQSSHAWLPPADRSLEVTLQAALPLEGIVLDESRQPVAGAIVTVVGSGSRYFDTVSAADGTYRLEQAWSSHELVRRPGLLPLDYARTGINPNPVLVDPRRLEGTVRRAGQPVAGARVTLTELRCREETLTDAQGRFRFEDLVPASHRLTAEDGTWWTQQEAFFRSGSLVTDVSLELENRAVVQGVVLDSQGKPFPHARVTVTAPDVEPVEGMADERGRYRLGALVAGRWRLEVQGRDVASATLEFEASPGATIEREVVLGRGTSLAGVVVDPEGKPVWNVGFTLLRGGSELARFSSAPDGTLRLGGLEPGRYTLTAKAHGFAPFQQRLELPSKPLRVALRWPACGAPARVAGRVLDADGRPVKARVALHDPVEGQLGSETTGEDGRFQFESVSCGPRLLGVVAETAPERSAPTRCLRVVVGAPGTRVEATLPRARPVTGVLLDAQGAPLAGWSVWLREKSEPSRGSVYSCANEAQVLTDGAGRFQTPPLPAGSYQLQSFAPASSSRLERVVQLPQPSDWKIRVP